MKKIFNLSRILIILILFFLCACELLSDKNNDCDSTKMDKLEEPLIHVGAVIPFSSALIEGHTPEKVQISGSIRKIYCSGKESGNFSFNPTYTVYEESFDENIGNFILLQTYKYKFDNTRDKLIVMCRVKIYLEEGLIYESNEIHQEYFYKDIQYSASELKHFIVINPEEGLEWYKVTS